MKRRASRVRRAERRRGLRPPEVERGSGTAQMAAVSLVLLVVVGALAVVIGYLAALNEARGAADLVALSAAAERVRGADACRAARSTASANQVAVTGCRVVGDTLDFVVVSRLRVPYGLERRCCRSGCKPRREPGAPGWGDRGGSGTGCATEVAAIR